MIKINSDGLIYVLCPENVVTGGTELAHQLVDYLRNNSKEAYLVYFEKKELKISDKQIIPENFQSYNIKNTSSIIDSEKNILVIPEAFLGWAYNLTNIQMIYWWMSVDNFYKNADIREYLFFSKNVFDIAMLMGSRLKNRIKLFNGVFLKKIKAKQNNSLHVFQSVYAEQHLLKENIFEILPLSDYINTEFISTDSATTKENIVLYNPSKGLKFTKKIIAKLPKVTFVPLKGLTRSELNSYLKRAKLYIDFGEHPGKDRLPREAAINNCCVITGSRGSSRFFLDVPIYSKYKFKNRNSEISSISKLILDILENYPEHIDNFSFYKKMILEEKSKFYLEINDIFFSTY